LTFFKQFKLLVVQTGIKVTIIPAPHNNANRERAVDLSPKNRTE